MTDRPTGRQNHHNRFHCLSHPGINKRRLRVFGRGRFVLFSGGIDLFMPLFVSLIKRAGIYLKRSRSRPCLTSGDGIMAGHQILLPGAAGMARAALAGRIAPPLPPGPSRPGKTLDGLKTNGRKENP
jgi:hypothetical protein